MKDNKILTIVLALVAVAALVFGFVANGQKGTLQTKVDELTKKVEELTGELDTAEKELADVKAAAPLFKTSIQTSALQVADATQPQVNLLREAKIVAVSGEVNEDERAALLMDGNPDTKWCDAQAAPNYVVFDFGKPTTVSRWRLLSAATEQSAYITRTCLLQGCNSDAEDWRTLDMFDGNRNNYTDRSFTATSVRYLRLFVVSPTQGQASAARIYELEVY